MQEARSFLAYKDVELYLNRLEEEYLKEHGSLNVAVESWLSTARKIVQSKNLIYKRLILLIEL